ncbi:LysR family transcriptional regulator [Pseudovibrio sp. Tun.PSC04-5.I4]|uniref:LysR family transcriptional regulator n=1 Tax=Pseudovibrio sp. Tun.PSC04-5.I4 TaxID=1798213 RepID=UPI00088490FF|nr:LysR family transcriptional regulator [Pseudovibrio sp. Tun.PSC04-5.I4]SDR19541.1 DNA-binding transcriptional regulator, LysR family [Pseudovibrio sp. Tun.PSC04-5.I4]
MNRINQYTVDGRLLAMFVAVYETGSVTASARSLNVTQSTVSHGLNRLRDITGDALFVPMGRGITPTEKADLLVEDARRILLDLAKFSQSDVYDPSIETRAFVIAANDYEIEVIVKPLIARLRESAPNAQIQIIRALAQDEWADLLRSGSVDLVLAPELTSDQMDIKQQLIISDDIDVCYYDPNHGRSPNTLDLYCVAQHVVMMPGRFGKTRVDSVLAELGRQRRIAVSVPSFASVATILRGSKLVAMMPLGLKTTTFSDLAFCPPPFAIPSDTISQIWHIRADASPRHRWLRSQVRTTICND